MLETFEFVSYSLGSTSTNLSLTDNMMTAKNLKILDLRTMQFNSISSNFGTKWSNLEVIIFTNVHCNNVVVLNSWINLSNLQWLDIDYSYFKLDNRTDEEFLCQLKNLRLIAISGVDNDNNYLSIPECVGDLEQLLYLTAPNVYQFDIDILLIPTLIGISSFGNFLNVDEVENRLLSLNETENIEIMYSKEIFFQQSLICILKNFNDTNFEINYPLTSKLMDETNGCFEHCVDSITSITCQPNRWHNGVCDWVCDNPTCSYDGGDCIQMCDFNVCNYTSLGDGICNVECRNKNCAFDYCDCFDLKNIDDASELEENQCNTYNETLCGLKTDCFVANYESGWGDDSLNFNFSFTYDDLDSLETESWIGDGICDDNCDNIFCDYDGGDCKDCGSSGCFQFWYYFDTAANFYTYDYKISQSELCVHWDLLKTVLSVEPKYNCNKTVIAYDLNNDTLLNPYETFIMAYHEYGYTDAFDSLGRAEQINCSLCAPSVQIYYN